MAMVLKDGGIWKMARWARWDSNPQPRDYESPALTIELQARLQTNVGAFDADFTCHFTVVFYGYGMNATAPVKTWNRTSVQNLLRHNSGRYYARVFANGKETWKSLKTDLLEV